MNFNVSVCFNNKLLLILHKYPCLRTSKSLVFPSTLQTFYFCCCCRHSHAIRSWRNKYLFSCSPAVPVRCLCLMTASVQLCKGFRATDCLRKRLVCRQLYPCSFLLLPPATPFLQIRVWLNKCACTRLFLCHDHTWLFTAFVSALSAAKIGSAEESVLPAYFSTPFILTQNTE